jgi:hypothetical protein
MRANADACVAAANAAARALAVHRAETRAAILRERRGERAVADALRLEAFRRTRLDAERRLEHGHKTCAEALESAERRVQAATMALADACGALTALERHRDAFLAKVAQTERVVEDDEQDDHATSRARPARE